MSERQGHGALTATDASSEGDRIPNFLVCDHDPYPKVDPGEYQLYCDEVKIYFDPGLKTWKCRLRFFDPLQEGFPKIYAFINLGKDRKPPGRRSRYFREWAIANGGHPVRRQLMSERVFKRKFFLVEVGWVGDVRHDGKLHNEHSRYSVVTEIKELACEGVAGVPKHSST